MYRIQFLPMAMLFALAVFITGCTIPLRTVVQGQLRASDVPADFDPQKHVLLVMAIQRLEKPGEVDEKNTQKLEAALQEHFPYRYKIVTKKEVYDKQGKYADTSIYRYAVVAKRKVLVDDWTLEGELEEGLSFSPGFRRTYIDFAFYNRVDNSHYPFSGSGTSVMRIAVSNVATRIQKALANRAPGGSGASTTITAKQKVNNLKQVDESSVNPLQSYAKD